MKTILRALVALVGLLCTEVYAGNLKVTLAPSQAVTAGAQWRVDGGSWRNSGTTATNLSNTTHVVNFKATTGWIAPADVSVTLSNGVTTSLTGTYVTPASLKINLTPTTGKWRLDGGTWQSSGATVSGLAPGNHAVDYQAISGYVSPAAETATLTSGQTTTLTRTYTQLASLKINLTPTTGKWRIDGGSWQNNGATVPSLTPGAHTVDYQAVSGYNPPPTETVTLTAGQTTTLSRSYVQLAQLTVTLTPGSAQWRVDGGAWRNSGTTATGLTPGNHTVDYSTVSGYTAPASETVTLTAGQAGKLSRAYVQLASLAITLTPGSAQWQVDGGVWRNSGTTATGLTPGNHTVNYSAVSGYTAPASETVTLTAGQALTISRSYTALSQLSITLTPGTGQWRVDGGAWMASGAVAGNLAPGNHAVEYSPLNQYLSPTGESVTLASGQALNLSRSYVPLAQASITLVPASGQWRLNGGAWQASGTSLFVPAGAYTIEYSSLPLYDPPANDVITLAPAGVFITTRQHISQKPTLQVDLNPNTGQWRVDGGGWQASGTRLTELATGSHTVDYTDIGGEFAPLSSETVTLALRENATLARTYPFKTASLTIALTPAAGQWSIDGTGPNASGATVSGLTPGNHQVQYGPVDLYNPPAVEMVSLTPGQAASLSRAYTPVPATLIINLSLTAGQWRAYPAGGSAGAWQAGGAVLSLAPGDYTIEYAGVADYTAPATETITLTSTQYLNVNRAYAPIPAQLSVTLNQPLGGWRFVGSGPSYYGSGTVLSNLASGDYAIEYRAVTGYSAPATENVTLAPGQTLALTRDYIALPTGQVSITVTPAGAEWNVNNGPWQTSGATVTAPTGSNTVKYASVTGYVTPPIETVNVIGGETTELVRDYVRVTKLTITLAPIDGQWRVDSGPWRNSGATFSGIAAGSHTITYSTEPFHSAPPSETVTLAAGDQLAFTRNYTPLTQISMNLTPTGGQWRLDGGAWRSSGLSEDLTPGAHTLDYLPLDGYDTPPAETVTLAAGQTHWLYRSYGLAGQLSVSLNPASAQWRVDGGAWQASGATIGNLSATQHVVEYQSLPGYIAPASESVAISAGATTQLTRTYTADPAFAIIHSFADAGTSPTALRASDGRIYVAANTGVSNGLGHLFRINPDGTGFQRLKWFGSDPADGVSPKALIEGSDGVLYGTTLSGPGGTGTISNGRVYRINKDGTGYAVLAIFNQLNQGAPNSLLEGADGILYGTTSSSGSTAGKIFKINRDGTGFTIMHNLTAGWGSNPQGLVQAPSGVFYGIARSGGPNSSGSIFKFTPNGTGYALVRGFAGGADGADPRATLLVGSDQMLYGTTYAGGAASRGLVYRINQDGSGYQVLRSFAATPDGTGPEYALVEDASGVLYGTTLGGGASSRGTLFRINKDGTGYSIVWNFSGTATDGGLPKMKLVSVGNGTFAGATTFGGAAAKGLLFTIKDDGSNFAVLRQLGMPAGGYPWSPVISGGNGVLYGTTYLGGTGGTGTIYRINEDGSGYTVLQSLPGPSGGIPIGALLLASNGALYGTTYSSSILFRVNTDGSGFTVLQNITDGTWSGVIEGTDGALYGASFVAVYRIAKDGSGLTTLHAFAGGTADGTTAQGGLVQGADGRLYGTTYGGGSANAGVIFSLNKDGTVYTILRHFLGGAADGSAPSAEMIQGSDGALYGTTYGGGAGNFGTLFKINPDGTGYTVLRIFTGTATDGALPSLAGLLEKDGFLYGATIAGGSFNKGTLYRLHKDGTGFEILVNFGMTPDDAIAPYSGLIEGTNGRLFGTTPYGADAGSIFRLRVD